MIKNTFKNSIIKQFRDSFGSRSDKENFILIGRVLPWENENSPPDYKDTIDDEKELRNSALVIKKLFPDSVSFCVKRINWEYGKVYSKFDDSIELYSDENPVEFYVMNSEKNVYKCLDNNNGAVSTVSPSGTESEIIILSDGYQWKYLYSISEQLSKFITDEYIPIEFLDKLIYDPNDPRINQLSAELDAKANGRGKITSVEITQTGGSFPFAVDYDQNILTYVPEDDHFVQAYVKHSEYESIFVNIETGDINRQDNFYKNNYVIYFCKGPGAGQVRNISSFNGSTGEIVLETELSIDVTTETMYKLLPKISVLGDGFGASLIPKLNLNDNTIENVIVLSGGVGYSRVELTVSTTRVGNENKTILRPIFTPYYGHSSNAFKELGCRNLMVHTKFGYNDKNMNFYNEFRQIALIQNPKILVKEAQGEKIILDIEATSAIQELNITICTKCDQAVSLPTSIFNSQNISKLIGTTLVQGIIGSGPYGVGIIKSWDATNKVLTVLTTVGKFVISGGSSPLKQIYIKDYPNKPNLSLTNAIAITSVKEKNYYTSGTFVPGSKIISDETYTTGTVDSWTVDSDRISGQLVLKDVKGDFKPSYYDLSGKFNKGENIVQFYMNIDDSNILISNGIQTTGTIKSILPQINNRQDEIYSCMTKIEITRMAGVSTQFSPDTFIRDAYIQQISTTGEVIARGVIIDWTINNSDTTKTSGVLLVDTVYGEFFPSTNRNIYQYEDGEYMNVEDTIICTVTDSEVNIDTGDIIYAHNIVKLNHGNDSLEEIKLVIGF